MTIPSGILPSGKRWQFAIEHGHRNNSYSPIEMLLLHSSIHFYQRLHHIFPHLKLASQLLQKSRCGAGRTDSTLRPASSSRRQLPPVSSGALGSQRSRGLPKSTTSMARRWVELGMASVWEKKPVGCWKRLVAMIMGRFPWEFKKNRKNWEIIIDHQILICIKFRAGEMLILLLAHQWRPRENQMISRFLFSWRACHCWWLHSHGSYGFPESWLVMEVPQDLDDLQWKIPGWWFEPLWKILVNWDD